MQQPQATLPDRSSRPKTFRTTARVVGVIYLAGMLIGIPANLLVLSILNGPDHLSTIAASSLLLATCVVFWLCTVAGDAAHGVLMFPVLKQHSERSAVGYLAARIMDATFIAVMALLILVQIPIANEYLNAGSADASYLQALSAVFNHAYLYAYEFGMITVGVAGSDPVLRLLPVAADSPTAGGLGPRRVRGPAGGSVLQILGFELNSIQAIPGGLWEIFIGVWLIVKGFSTPSHLPSEPTTSSTTPVEMPPLVASTTL